MAVLTRHAFTVLGLVAAVGCAVVYWPRSATTADPAAAATPGRPGVQTVVGPGRIEPLSGEIDLAADITGVLAAIPVKEGDHVAKGQVLAEFVNRDAMSRVDQASATLQMQAARLDKLKKGPRTEERQQAIAALQEQDATLSRVQRDLVRQKTLFNRGYASNAQLEQAQSAQAVAEAKKKSSAQALAQMDAGPRTEDVSSAEAEVKLARAQLDEARAALDKTKIHAPIDGVILRVYKHPGEAVSLLTSAAVLQIGDTDHLVVRTQIDEADVAQVVKGARASVTTPAFPGQTFGGAVTDVSPRLGAKTIQTGSPTEKRDASVLDVLVTLDPGTRLPIGLRVDCYIQVHGTPS